MALTTMYHPYYAQQGSAGSPPGMLPPYLLRFPGYPAYAPMLPFSQLPGLELTFPLPAAYSAAMLAVSAGPDYAKYYLNMAELQNASAAQQHLGYESMYGVGAFNKEGEDISRTAGSGMRTSSPSSTEFFPRQYGGHAGPSSDRHRHSREKHGSRRSEGGKVGPRPRDSGSGSERRMNPLLEDFRSQKGENFELSDLLGNLYDFSKDQHGSRFIQQKLDSVNQDELDAAFEEILPHCVDLVTDIFGNYVMQKFLAHGTTNHRDKIAQQIQGQILTLSLQMYGCRVVQKALEVLSTPQQIAIAQELKDHVMQCVRDQNGNHVIQKCIECIPSQLIPFVIDPFLSNIIPLSTHSFGCRVIQRILEHCDEQEKRSKVIEEVLKATSLLAQDQYGNYVVQHVLEHGEDTDRNEIVRLLSPDLLVLSQHKFASNVVEMCLLHGGSTAQNALFEELTLKDDSEFALQAIMKDQFGNYVVQKLLEVCTEDQREVLLERIRSHLHTLKRLTYGKHIVARVEKLLSTGTQLQAQVSLKTLNLNTNKDLDPASP